jgi:hypothetical protein
MMLGRKRLSFSSIDVHTSQSQAIMGTPALVPEPKKVIVREGYATTKSTKSEVRNGWQQRPHVTFQLPGTNQSTFTKIN